MKVLHVVPTYFPATIWGGPIYSVGGLNNAISKIANLDLTVITTNAGGFSLFNNTKKRDYLKPRNFRLIYCHRIAFVSVSLDLVHKLIGLVKKNDLIHISAFYSFSSFVAILMAFFYGKKIVIFPHGAILNTFALNNPKKLILKKIWIKFFQGFIKSNAVIVSNSKNELDITSAIFPSSHNIFIPHGVVLPNLAEIKHEVFNPSGELRLIFLGRLSPEKGVDNLLKTMSLLKNEKISLKIYGDGPKNYVAYLHSIAKKLSLSAGLVEFMGEGIKGEGGLFPPFLGADVCVIPSYIESFGLVAVEAMAHGIPIIVSKNAPWEVVREVGCGLWVNNDPADLAQAILDIRKMPIKEMGQKAREYVEINFSWEGIANTVADVYFKHHSNDLRSLGVL